MPPVHPLSIEVMHDQGGLRRRAHLDDACAGVGDNAGHLHGVPSRPAAHDIAIEGVEDALVRQLQAVIQHHHVCSLLDPYRVALRLRGADKHS